MAAQEKSGKSLPENYFARNLLFLMEELGVTQETLSEDVGVSQAAISRYLQGRIPRAETLVDLGAYFMGTEVADLLYRDLSLGRGMKRLKSEKPGRQPLSALKLLKSDPAAVLAQSEDIKARYAKLFKV